MELNNNESKDVEIEVNTGENVENKEFKPNKKMKVKGEKKKKSFLFSILVYLVLIFLFFVILLELRTYVGFDISKYVPDFLNQKLYETFNIKRDIKTSEPVEEVKEIDVKSIVRPEYYDKYSMNNIKIKNVELSAGPKVINYMGEETDFHKFEGKYIQISGLKDEEIEDKINNELKELVNSFMDEDEILDEEIYSISADTYVSGNYANILSVEVYKYIYYEDDEKETDYKIYTFNYRLDNGEQVSFEELFTADANINLMLYKSFYEASAWELFGRVEYDEDSPYDYDDFRGFDAEQLENTVDKLLKQFKSLDEIKYLITETEICLVFNDRFYDIYMLDNYKYMNIFNIVKSSQSLYKEGNKEEKGYVFRMNFDDNFVAYEKLDKNKFFSVFNPFDNPYYDDEDEETLKKRELIDDNLDKIKKVLKFNISDSSKGYAINIDSWGDNYIIDYDSDTHGLVFSGEIVEFNYSYTEFDSTIDMLYAKCSERSNAQADYYFYLTSYSFDNYDDMSTYTFDIYDVDGDGNFEFRKEKVDYSYNQEEQEENNLETNNEEKVNENVVVETETNTNTISLNLNALEDTINEQNDWISNDNENNTTISSSETNNEVNMVEVFNISF